MKKWMQTGGGGGGLSIFIMEFRGYGRIMQLGNSEGKGRGGGLKYGSRPWYNWYGYFLESPIFRHIQNLTTFFSFY